MPEGFLLSLPHSDLLCCFVLFCFVLRNNKSKRFLLCKSLKVILKIPKAGKKKKCVVISPCGSSCSPRDTVVPVCVCVWVNTMWMISLWFGNFIFLCLEIYSSNFPECLNILSHQQL